MGGVIPLPKYGFHTFVGDGTKAVKAGWSSSGEGTEEEGAATVAQPQEAPAVPKKKSMFGRFGKGGKGRRRSRRRRKSRKSRKSRRKRRKSRRKRKRSRRRRRRR